MRTFVLLAALCVNGCAYYTVNPGHRGLRFDPHEGGLHQQVLQPGICDEQPRGPSLHWPASMLGGQVIVALLHA